MTAKDYHVGIDSLCHLQNGRSRIVGAHIRLYRHSHENRLADTNFTSSGMPLGECRLKSSESESR